MGGVVKWWFLTLAAAVALLAGAPYARAAGVDLDAVSEADKSMARHLVATGDQHFAQGRYDRALDAYRGAHAIMGVPTTGIEVARTLATVGKLTDALGVVEQVLAYPQRDDEPSAFRRARVQAAELQRSVASKVARLRVTVRPARAVTAIEIDGRPAPSLLAGKAMLVDPGEHTVVARNGKLHATRRIRLTEGQNIEVDVALTDAADTPEFALDAEPGENTGLRSPLLWSGIAVAGLGLVTASVTGALSLSIMSDVDDRCSEDDVCPEDTRDDVDRARVLAHVSTAGFATTGAGVALALVGLFVPSDDGSEAASSTPSVEPQLTPGFVGVRGRF